jgi:hypothetical protein
MMKISHWNEQNFHEEIPEQDELNLIISKIRVRISIIFNFPIYLLVNYNDIFINFKVLNNLSLHIITDFFVIFLLIVFKKSFRQFRYLIKSKILRELYFKNRHNY